MEQLGILLAIGALVCWALSDIITKVSLGKASKWKVIFIAQIVGTLMMLLVALLLGQLENLFTEGLPWLLLLAFVNFIGIATFYKAMHEKNVSLVSPVVNAWAVVTIVLGIIFYGEVVNALQWAAIVLILAGIFAISIKKGTHIELDKALGYAILSTITWGLFFFILKIPGEIFGAITITLAVRLFTGIFSIPMVFIRKVQLLDTKLAVLLFICLLAVLDTTGFLAYNFAVLNAPVSIVAPITAAVPAISVVLRIFVLKETMSARQALGVVSAVIGIILLAI